MAKLTKAESKAHNKALDLVHSDRELTFDEKVFILENYHEGGCCDNTRISAHFTPLDLAYDFALDVAGPRVLDLCAGIGVLAFAWFHRARFQGHHREVTCLEGNAKYVEVGRRVLPEADWKHGNVFDDDLRRDLAAQGFTTAISNPPFGSNAKIQGLAPHYTGSQFEYAVIDVASELADYGVFILPQAVSPFVYSGARAYSHCAEAAPMEFASGHHSRVKRPYERFRRETCIDLSAGCGVDTTVFSEQWRGVKPLVEIATADFTAARIERAQVLAPLLTLMAA